MARLARCSKLLLLLFLPVLQSGCRDEQAGPRPRMGASTRRAVPAGGVWEGAAPPLTYRSGATLAGGSIEYLGSTLSPTEGRPGTALRLAHYFVARKTPPSGYSFFVHLIDAQSGQMVLNADHAFAGGALPLERWPVGKIVEDVHQVTPPPGGGRIQVVLGFWNDEGRMKVDDAARHDGRGRVLGPVLRGGEVPLPEYRATRTRVGPRMDGVLNDPVWSRAPTVRLVDSLSGQPARLRTEAQLTYDDEYLYVAFDCEDPDVWGTLEKRDAPIYNEEVVEVFLDANADGRTYNELEVSPHNVLFDAFFPARRRGMDLSYDSGAVTAVRVRGTADNPSDRDEGWSVEMKIPLSRLAEVPRLPPAKGDRWRFNLYRLEHHGRREVEGHAFSALFKGDFHHLPRFGWLVFEGESTAPTQE